MKNPTLWAVIALSISAGAIVLGSEPTEQRGGETIELISAWVECNEAIVASPNEPMRIEKARKDLEEFDKDAVTALNAYGNARYQDGRSDALR